MEVQFGNDGGAGAPQAGVPPAGTAPPDARIDQRRRGTGPLLRSIAADISTLVSKRSSSRSKRSARWSATRAKAVGVFGAAAVLGLFVIGFLGWPAPKHSISSSPDGRRCSYVAGVFGVLAAAAIVAPEDGSARARQSPN